MTEEDAKQKMRIPLNSWNGAQGEFRDRVLTPAEQQQQIINDHSQSIEEIRAAVGQGLLQGQSIKFESNNTYYPSEGITSFDVILIGAGGGGGGARWDIVFNSLGGCGGSGGGEVHTTIPASLLPVESNGQYAGIPIIVGAGGAGAPYDGVGTGGGNSSLSNYLTAGGGLGGTKGAAEAIAAEGGIGMISGGKGGVNYKDAVGGNDPRPATAGGNSISPYSLNGGGGGGGAGAGTQGSWLGSNGGAGGISLGGAYAVGVDGAPGSSPSPVVATGGGGGAGGGQGCSGGAGGYPGGGGGGAGGSSVSGQTSMRGGGGAHGIVFIIERFG